MNKLLKNLTQGRKDAKAQRKIKWHYIGCEAGWVAKMWKRAVWGVVVLVFGVSLVRAQDDTKAVIDAGNIDQLQSVNQINFDDLRDDLGEIINGRFLLRDDGEHIAVVNRENQVLVVDSQGNFIGGFSVPSEKYRGEEYSVTNEQYTTATFLDGDFYPSNGFIASIYTDGVSAYYADGDYTSLLPPSDNHPNGVRVYGDEMFTEVWVGEDNSWVVNDWGYVSEIYSQLGNLFPSPSFDPESVIRIGRINQPLAVTVTDDGRVKRWNMETGEVTAEVQINPEDGLPIYGALNAGGDSDLLWRDPASKAFHVLNFETGKDRTVVPLSGAYIPFIFLSQQSDVIIGVNIDDQPIVVAWNVTTGERYDLGQYRECNRPPDMVRLSQDGTTLVIGCDTGLDIWRVSPKK